MKREKPTRKPNLLKTLVDLQLKAEALPPLSHLEKVKLDHAMALDQLYYSSRVEGSVLTRDMLEKAIHFPRS